MPVRHFNTPHRYPQLQKVIDRLDSDSKHYISSRTIPSTDQTSVSSSSFLRTSETHAKAHEEDYDDDHIDEDDDEEEDEDDDEEDEDEDEEESDKKTVKDHQRFQPHSEVRPPWESGRTTTTSRSTAFRPTPTSTPTPQPHHHHHHDPPQQPPMSTYSQFKWNTFGRRPELDDFRNSRMNINNKKPNHNTDDASKAMDHAHRVNRDILCRVPRAKVIHVKDIYPHSSDTYVPPCTVLHQCGDDTGCCRSATQSCVAKRSQPVELYFYISSTIASTMDVGSRYRPHSTPGGNVVKLLFDNHTECSCQDKHDEQMPRDMEPMPQRNHFQAQTTSSSLLSSTTTYRPYHQQSLSTHETPAKNCRCPSEFYPRHLANGSCTCDCFDKQRDCLRFKKGKEYFTHQDKLCIERRLCHMPQCEYGSYLREAGRCPTPRKQDKFSSWQHY